jgi:hypothetical protein
LSFSCFPVLANIPLLGSLCSVVGHELQQFVARGCRRTKSGALENFVQGMRGLPEEKI